MPTSSALPSTKPYDFSQQNCRETLDLGITRSVSRAAGQSITVMLGVIRQRALHTCRASSLLVVGGKSVTVPASTSSNIGTSPSATFGHHRRTMSSAQPTSDKELQRLFLDVKSAWPKELGENTWYLGVVCSNNLLIFRPSHSSVTH